MQYLRLALRLLRRDYRSGELRLLAGSLIVATAAMSAVAFVADRVRLGLELNARQLLGADLLLVADHPWRPAVAEAALQQGLAVAQTLSFPSMASTGRGSNRRSQLADIKAVTPNYPLRGQLRIAADVNAVDAPAKSGPDVGSIWLDERLAAALAAVVGDRVEIGRSSLRVAAILTFEPDRGLNFFSLAPRLMMNWSDVDATGLVQVGSRISYRLLVAGADPALERFRRQADAVLERGEHADDASNARPEVRKGLQRAQAYLGLAAVLTVVLAAAAVALTVRRYVDRRLDACALMRCLGASQSRLFGLHLVQFAVFAMLSSAIGTLFGFALHFLLQTALAGSIGDGLPAPSWRPAGQGMAVGTLLLLGFALPALVRIRRVPTMRVLRRELEDGQRSWLWAYAAGLGGLAGLMFWIADDARLGGYVVGGLLLAVCAFAVTARLLLKLGLWTRRRRRSGGFGWRYGIAAVERRAGGSVLQIVALALGYCALLLLTVTRSDLMDAWRRSIPPDAPNRFVINIQSDQVAAMRSFFAADGVAAELFPMVRGRLTAVNGREINGNQYSDDRARRLAEREFNLSWRADLPPGNRLESGRWFTADDVGRNVVSIETGLAKTLGLQLGDRLQFTIGGETVEFGVVGMRKLDWESMQVNFFVLLPPGVLERYPASYITSFHYDRQNRSLVEDLLGRFPNLTVIDVGSVLAQVQEMIGRIAASLAWVFALTLAAGLLVLIAAFAAFVDEREMEIVVMRSLGARRSQLRRALMIEFAVIGGVAGAIAALASIGIGAVLARQVFDLEFHASPYLPPLATSAGALTALATGWLLARPLLDAPPMDVLRRST